MNSWYPSRVFPQNGDFIQRHAEAVATKHRVTAIHAVTYPNIEQDEIEEYEKNGVRTLIAYLPPSRIPGTRPFNFVKTYKKLIRLAGEYDLIHLNRIWPAGIATLFEPKPLVISEHFTGYLPDLRSQLSPAERFFARKITQKAAFVCPVSRDLAEQMQALGFKGNFRIVPNVVDTGLFFPAPSERKIFTLIHISSLNDTHKNIKGILRVIRRLQDEISIFRFIMVGPEPDRYLHMIDKLGIKKEILEFTGQIAHNEVPAYLNRADVLVQFSRYENLPCVILEAFSCGVPVISTDVGGIAEHFPEGFGKLIEKNDEDALLQAILELHTSYQKTDRQRMYNYAREHFGMEQIAERFSELYFKALNLQQ